MESRPDDASDLQPDIDAFFAGHRFIIDVAIVHPTAPSHVQSAAKASLLVAEAAAKAKREKYQQLAKKLNATLVPL